MPRVLFPSIMLVLILFFIPVNVEGLQVTAAAVSLDKSEYTVGDQPTVTVEDTHSDFDPNTIDSISVVVKAMVGKGYVGTTIATVTIQETGPDTRIFSGVLPEISAEVVYNYDAQIENKWLEVSYMLGSTNNAVYATLIQPAPEPEPETPPSTQSEPEYDSGSSGCPQISNWELEDSSLTNYDYYDRLECHYFDHDSNLSPRSSLTSHIFTSPDAAKSIESCSGNWIKNYYQGELYSSSHHLNVYYQYDDDGNYDQILSAARSLLQQLESKNAAVTCDAQPTPEPTPKPAPEPKTEPKPEPTTELKPAPKPSTDGVKDSRCPANYPIFLEKYGLCQADVATDPRCTDDFPIFLEEHGVCAAIERVSTINPIPLSELNNYSQIMEEGKRLRFDDKNYDKAILYFKKAIQLEPDNVRGYFHIAETLYYSGDKKASVEYYYKILELSPSHLTAKRVLQAMNLPLDPTKLSDETPEQTEYDGWIKKGTYDLANRNYDDAIRDFDLAYKQNPNDQNLINLKSEALKKKGMALADDGKFDLAVVFLGESNHLKPDEFVKAIQNNAYNRWSDEIKQEAVGLDPNVIDKFNKYDFSTITLPPLPTVGKVSPEHVESNSFKVSLGQEDHTFLTPGTPLKVGDVIFAHDTPVILDWGYATTTIEPNSIFLIGNPEDLQAFAKGKPHYIELIDGQIRIYDGAIDLGFEEKIDFEKKLGLEETPSYLIKTAKNQVRIGGTDVTIIHDKTTGISSIQIDDGKVQVYDVITDAIKEFGAGTTLVTNNDGYYLEQAAAQPEHETMVTEMQEKSENLNGGGCLIATATFGSELAPQVQQLRELRDNTLLQTESGSAFMTGFNEFYYSFSPGIADLERQNPVFKGMVKLAITPLITSLSILNYVEIDSEAEMLSYGISLILLNVGMYFAAPAALIWKLKKRSA